VSMPRSLDDPPGESEGLSHTHLHPLPSTERDADPDPLYSPPRMETVAGFAPLYPPYGSHHRGGQSQWIAPTSSSQGCAEGRSPLNVRPSSKSRIPRECRDSSLPGSGVSPDPSLCPQEREPVLKGSERVVAGGHGPPYGYCWIPASAGMTRRRCLPKASLKPASTRVPKGRA
jgi:hypothetical protein